MFKVHGKVFFDYAQGAQQSFGPQKNYFWKYLWNVPLWIPI
jgi:hypothetical protein